MFSLQTAVNARLSVQPFPFLQLGQIVRINHGVLAGVEGIVINLKPYLRLVLSVTLLQRSVLLEIDRDQVSAERMLERAA
jgi:transcription antitermination factor NusG